MIRSWHVCALAQLCLAACGNDLGHDPAIDVDAGLGPPSQRGGLPCDVQTLLMDRCQSCHGTTPANGAPISLVTYGDLTSKNADGDMIAQRALKRVKNSVSQMPPLPAPAVTAMEIAALEAWITAGAPSGECVPMPGPFDGPTVCTSGTMWDRDDDESPVMHPGRACITCHSSSDDDDAPRFRIAGTVYPTGHEPNDCNGATSATVEVTDASGSVTMLRVNSAGNFFTTSAIPFPIRVAVLANGKRRAMGASPPRGDCNSCHTPDGANGAPGRITLP